MAAAEGHDLYICDLCYENMLDKDPRFLSCLHSFCINCLMKTVNNDTIICPTCKEMTTVPDNDISLLRVNLLLRKFKTVMDKIQSSKMLCQFCLVVNATLKCQECSQLICEECSEKHKTMKTFKDHKMYKLCDKHKDGMITHVCIKCARPACAKCVMTEHFDHEAEMETFPKYIDTVNEEILKFEAEIDNVIESVNEFRIQDKKELENIKIAISKVKNLKAYHLEKAEQAEQILENLQNNEVKGEEIDQIYETRINKCRTVKTLLQKNLKDVEESDIENYVTVKKQVEHLLDEVKHENNRLIQQDLAGMDFTEEKEINPKVIQALSEPGENYLKTPVLEKTVSCPGKEHDEWRTPYNIAHVDSDCILISDWSKDQVTCVYKSDKPSVIIPSQHHGYVKDAHVYGSHLYTAYTDCITTRTFSHGTVGAEVTYRPNIKDIFSMLVVNDSCVVLVSGSEQRIVEFNPHDSRTKVVVSLDGPVQVNMKREGRILYLVTCQYTHSIYVYDNNWTILFTFGGFGHKDGQLSDPWGTTCTTEGILVADQGNNRICEYSFEGKFVNNILTSKDDIGYPVGLIFIKPFLWVTSHSSGSVKCFKLCK